MSKTKEIGDFETVFTLTVSKSPIVFTGVIIGFHISCAIAVELSRPCQTVGDVVWKRKTTEAGKRTADVGCPRKLSEQVDLS